MQLKICDEPLILTELTVLKYKGFKTEQKLQVDPRITCIVGMNESGKSSLLELLSKSNYHEDDSSGFNFDTDYPVSELEEAKAKLNNSKTLPIAKLKFLLPEAISKKIRTHLGDEVLPTSYLTFHLNYHPSHKVDLQLNLDKYKEITLQRTKSSPDLPSSKNYREPLLFIDAGDFIITDMNLDEIIFREAFETAGDEEYFDAYVFGYYCLWNLPKFLYLDQYTTLPDKIKLSNFYTATPPFIHLVNNQHHIEAAFLLLGNIGPKTFFPEKQLPEDKIRQILDAAGKHITEEIRKYWKNSKDFSVYLELEGNTVDNAFISIQINHHELGNSLSLSQQSLGFKWFFTFYTLCSSILKNRRKYIILLDEPGNHLHGSAQANLLNFLNEISKDIQIIFTTHSPFMVTHLDQVRSVYYDQDQGSVITGLENKGDPARFLPLQAALGYDVAQNLFITKNNLVVEGVSDRLYLEHFSGLLEEEGLSDDISIIPAHSLSKVENLVSFLYGQKLNVVCLLDFALGGSDQCVNRLSKLGFLDSADILCVSAFITPGDGTTRKDADIEDMLEPEEYLALYNAAYNDDEPIKLEDLDHKPEYKIIQSIRNFNNKRNSLAKKNSSEPMDAKDKNSKSKASKSKSSKGHDHHLPPAKLLRKVNVNFSEQTLDRFRTLFKRINDRFEAKDSELTDNSEL